MSLQAPLASVIPEETARVAHAAFPKGHALMRFRDELGPIYANPDFAALFARVGRPAEDPARLALVLVLQFVEQLSDRQAADAVRGRIDWKYALALELTDAGFDASVLSEFRQRLITGQAEEQLFTHLLDLLRERGLIKARGKQRTDSTYVLAAIRVLNRLMCVGETLRHALNELAVADPAWLQNQITPDWLARYSQRMEEFRLPKDKAERRTLANQIGTDGRTLLRALWASDAPAGLQDLPAVEILRRIWIQQYDAVPDTVTMQWREDADISGLHARGCNTLSQQPQ